MKTINKFNHIINIAYGSSSGNPDHKGIQTSDIRLWLRVDKGRWIKPNIHSIVEITNILESADNEEELLMLIKYIQE